MFLQISKLNELKGDFSRAKEILTRAREFSTGVRLWLYSVKLELRFSDKADETGIEKLVKEICDRFKQEEKVWAMVGELWKQRGKIDRARKAYAKGIDYN